MKNSHLQRKTIKETNHITMNIKQKFFLAFITIASLLTSPHAIAEDTPARNYGRGVFQDIPVLSQGDKVFIDKRKTCTVGYIDKEQELAYLAEHCAVSGETSQVHDGEGYFIGTITSRYSNPNSYGALHPQKMSEDFNAIKVDTSHVFLGDNKYSGDHKVSVSDVAQGDDMCMYSRRQGRINCGHVSKTIGSIIVGDSHTEGERGDSGGPVWIPEKGFIGVYTASLGGKFYGFSTSFEENKEEDNMVKNIVSNNLRSFTISSQSSSTGKVKWYRNEKLVKKAVVSSSVLFASFVALGF